MSSSPSQDALLRGRDWAEGQQLVAERKKHLRSSGADERHDVKPKQWHFLKGEMDGGLKLLSTKKKCDDLVLGLRSKMGEMKSMVAEISKQKDRFAITEVMPAALPTFDWEKFHEDSKVSSQPTTYKKGPGMVSDSRFDYNPIQEVERYLPGVGPRAIKSYRGHNVEVLGDPGNHDEKLRWRRKLRLEIANEGHVPDFGQLLANDGKQTDGEHAVVAEAQRHADRNKQLLSAAKETYTMHLDPLDKRPRTPPYQVTTRRDSLNPNRPLPSRRTSFCMIKEQKDLARLHQMKSIDKAIK
mmetsp:Transcript_5536/g.8828  ORF Transcript_5536/g.8828 Transcript_5536/m.8828 type:complete len:298 (-) Transcript_5536:23-916(-)